MIEQGSGRLAFAEVAGASALVAAEARSPLQLLAPCPRGALAWAVVVGHGGGLLAGDHVELRVEVGARARALVTTQAETKVYRAPGGGCARQRTAARVEAGAALAWFPDAVSPFAEARYDGVQRFDVDGGASLLAVDAVVAGRAARGERWRFAGYRSATEVQVAGRPVLADALRLDGGDALAPRLLGFEAFATAVLLGPAFAQAARALLSDVAARPVERGAAALVGASPLGDGAFLRLATRDADAMHRLVRDTLAPALAAIGAAPHAHRW